MRPAGANRAGEPGIGVSWRIHIDGMGAAVERECPGCAQESASNRAEWTMLESTSRVEMSTGIVPSPTPQRPTS
jgi:hypothetical protein